MKILPSSSELMQRITELTKGYENVVVVARGHRTLQRLTRGRLLNPVEELAMSCVSVESNNLEAVRNAINTFARWLASKLALEVVPMSLHRPIEIDSTLVWRQFIFNCLKFLSTCGASDVELTWKQWAALTKQGIRQLSCQPFMLAEIAQKLAELNEVNLIAPKGLGAEKLSTRLTCVEQQPVVSHRYATIHQVKGETHDATVLISSLISGKQSHWKDWLNDPLEEAARFAYVASSRPRHLLIWGVKALKPKEHKRLIELGFEIL